MLLTDWIWGTPEARLVKAQEAASQELTDYKNDYSDQKDLVAEKQRVVTQQQKAALAAEAVLQRSSKLYEDAIETMPVHSDERINLKVIFMKREAECKKHQESLSEAKKELKRATDELVEKEKKMLVAQDKYDAFIVKKSEPVQNMPKSSLIVPGKVQIPPAVEAHFNGKNREHISTPETQAVRHEVKTTKPSINVLRFKEKLEETLSLRMHTPHSTPIIHKNEPKLDPTFAFELEKKLIFEQDPEVGPVVQRPLCTALQNSMNGCRSKLPESLSDAIKARREKLGY